jgi:hypothetical protein
MTEELNDGAAPLRGDYADQWKHHTFRYLISSTKDHIVHIDTDGDLDWETTPQYDAAAPKNPAFDSIKRNSILSDAALLEASPRDGLPKDAVRNFRRLIGEAIVRCLEFDYTGAQHGIVAARRFFKARAEETSRKWYVLTCLAASAPLGILGALTWLFRDTLIPITSLDGLWLILSLVCGAFGALLSVLTRAGRLKFDSSAGRELHLIEGCSRILAGAASGVIVALAVRSGILLSLLAHNGNLHSVMILAALTAGYGERLAPSIISKFDTAHIGMQSDEASRTLEGNR